MKFHILLATTAMLALAACGGSGDAGIGGGDAGSGDGGGDTPPPTTENEDFAALTADLGAAVYDPDSEALTITLLPFDGSPVEAEYIRDATGDTGGFAFFSLEENSNARLYYAFFKSGDSTMAGTVATDVDFGTAFGGTTFEATAAGILPTQGIGTYLGQYVGLTTVTNGTGDGPTIINGDALINVDFNDSKIEGKILADGIIFNEAGVVQEYDPDLLNARLTLLITDLNGNEFIGTVDGDLTGTYGGVIGGDGGELAATVVVGSGEIVEYGAVVAPQFCLSSPESPC